MKTTGHRALDYRRFYLSHKDNFSKQFVRYDMSTFEENPLKAGFRNYPVDMIYPLIKTFHTIIEIPKGYKFAEQNKNITIDNALVRISYSTEDISDKLHMKGEYSFKKAVYLQNEYLSLKNILPRLLRLSIIILFL